MTDPSPRDPRIDPIPGDQMYSPGRLKVKVVSVTVEEPGITQVKYVVGRDGEEYWPTVASGDLVRWQAFTKDAEVLDARP